MSLSENHSALQKRISFTSPRSKMRSRLSEIIRRVIIRFQHGKFLGNADAEFLYEFKLDDDARMGDDVPVEIEVEGDITRGNVVSALKETGLSFCFRHTSEITWNMRFSALLHSSLSNSLSSDLESIEDKDTECIEALFDEDKDGEQESRERDIRQNLTIDPKELNEFQVNASRAVLQKQISFVWGPPGTGKTRDTCICRGKSGFSWRESFDCLEHEYRG